jgi:hypothetical protein
MKKMTLILVLFINFVSFAQNEIEETTLIEPNFSSESVIINDNSDIMIFKGNVSFLKYTIGERTAYVE